jgi:hypothetical protein
MVFALTSIALAGLDLLLSNGHPGEFLATLTAWPTRLRLSARKLRGVVNFEPRATEKVRLSAIHYHNYSLPKWWTAEYVPKSPAAKRLILTRVDEIAEELWNEYIAICDALERETPVNLELCQKFHRR